MKRPWFYSSTLSRRGWLARAALWPRRWTAGLRSLPDFLVIGAQRAGTTSLFRSLESHPQVLAAPIKEVHYFDTHADFDESWYRSHFPLRRRECKAGEATPYYLFHPRCPATVHAMVPGVRLIAVLRDPVERAVSQFRHEVRRGFETERDLATAIDLESSRMQGEEQRLLQDPSYFSHAHNHASYLARGEYARQIRAWLEFFPREQLLVLVSERMFADPSRELARAQEHIGVTVRELGDFPHFNGAGKAELEDGLRRRLVEHFRPHNRELYELLGEDLGWEA